MVSDGRGQGDEYGWEQLVSRHRPVLIKREEVKSWIGSTNPNTQMMEAVREKADQRRNSRRRRRGKRGISQGHGRFLGERSL